MNDFRTFRTDHRLGHASMQQPDPLDGAPATTTKKTTTAKISTTSDGGHVNGACDAISSMHRPVHGGFPGLGGRHGS